LPNLGKTLGLVVVGSLFLSGAVTACSATHEKPESKVAPISVSSAKSENVEGQVAANLRTIAETSQALMKLNGITETLYVNSNTDPRPFTTHGSISWTTASDVKTHTTLSRYPSNPAYREVGAGPQAVNIALETALGYLPEDPTPSEKAGTFTFPHTAQPGDAQVTVIYSAAGLITGVLVEDDLVNPSYTNFYQINAYNVTNATAQEVLFSKH